MSDIKEIISSGKAVLGIEFGSTRIKAVLVDENHTPIASGAHDWENRLVDGVWTYSLDDIHGGLRDCYANLLRDVDEKYHVTIEKLAAIGVSGMMHGYLPFDKNGELLVPFRTWRNTITGEAAAKLTKVFDFNVPQRWSIAHLYQAVLNGEEHVDKIDFFTTLAGYIHWKLTGEKVMGIGEASGMFPIDSDAKDYDAKMADKFDALDNIKDKPWKLREILPKVLVAGENAGTLTEEGAKFLDASGNLKAGIPLAPPEGDAGTGMTATNSVAVRTGNVSAGTSVFAMVVLEKALKKVHEELDMVTTPVGDAVAMVHCNNCTSDLNAWIGLFKEFADMFGVKADMNDIYGKLYNNAMTGEKDCGGLLAFNTFSGEPVIGLDEGRPMFARKPDAKMNLANFMRTHLYASLATLKIGCDILFKEEKVEVDTLYGHGGLFKTKGVGQSVLAAAMNAPVAVMETAGEGGPWGMAILASYVVNKDKDQTFADFLDKKVFHGEKGQIMNPDPEDVKGFDSYIEEYKAAISAEKEIVKALPII
ncbi:MAG: FGGY-family carbohydrate kinase [Lachnospiraceae bacterium]|nr:FGGY-family carbohydrate kinase [Lachnospiraceae bacterium]